MLKLLAACGFVLFAGSSFAQQASDAIAPERATPSLTAAGTSEPVAAKDWMVVAAHPLAVEAGRRILAEGGSAIDAAIAVQLVLGLVEPQSSGLGGGAFLLHFDAASGDLTTLDGRETAPSAARPQLFLDADGEPLTFFDAVVGGLSVGVPGTPRLLEEAHRRWGRLAWRRLFEDAQRLAREGFEVSPRLAGAVAADAERLATSEATAAYFLPGGKPLAAGARLVNTDYADTLAVLARSGADGFYGGRIAGEIVAAVGSATRPGTLAAGDLERYRVVERDPVCVTYRAYEVCGMGPPSSGGVALGQILKLIEPFGIGALGPDDPQSWRIIGDASRLAFADRERYLADSDFVPLPLKGLLGDAYLAARSELMRTDRALDSVMPGEPEWDHARLDLADGEAFDMPSTSHISIVDGDGNAVSMTTTIESGFGSRLMAAGFLLNNELTDFSFRTHRDGVPVANRVEPGKRPRSSMAPTIVLEDGRPRLVIGSPGGSQIIGYVAQAIIAHLDWGMDVQQAVAMPHVLNRFGVMELEAGTPAADLAPDLEALGFEVEIKDLNSGLHAIAIEAGGLTAGADPRREGIGLGR